MGGGERQATLTAEGAGCVSNHGNEVVVVSTSVKPVMPSRVRGPVLPPKPASLQEGGSNGMGNMAQGGEKRGRGGSHGNQPRSSPPPPTHAHGGVEMDQGSKVAASKPRRRAPSPPAKDPNKPPKPKRDQVQIDPFVASITGMGYTAKQVNFALDVCGSHDRANVVELLVSNVELCSGKHAAEDVRLAWEIFDLESEMPALQKCVVALPKLKEYGFALGKLRDALRQAEGDFGDALNVLLESS